MVIIIAEYILLQIQPCQIYIKKELFSKLLVKYCNFESWYTSELSHPSGTIKTFDLSNLRNPTYLLPMRI
jgi:hypothetical protein